MNIIPALLCKSFSDFSTQTKKLGNLFGLVQIDVMDGKMVPNKSFTEIDSINTLQLKTYFELHLMVEHPIEELKKWRVVDNIKRVIFHIESQDIPTQVIAEIRKNGWDVGLAISPETSIETILPYADQADVILFMTVHPGEQGAEFLPEVGAKIQQFRKLKVNHPAIAVDGGIKPDNIGLVKSWGVKIFCVGSALTLSEDVTVAYNKLKIALGDK